MERENICGFLNYHLKAIQNWNIIIIFGPQTIYFKPVHGTFRECLKTNSQKQFFEVFDYYLFEQDRRIILEN